MMIWKTKYKVWSLKQLIEDFSLFIKQCYRFVWSLQKNTGSKNPKVVNTKHGRIMLLKNMQCVIVKSQNVSKSKRLFDY